MKLRSLLFSTLLLVVLFSSALLQAQQTASEAVVPPMVNFSGALSNVNGKPLSGIVGVTFSLYKEQQGGAPLWLETQNVQADANGHYTVMLGSTKSTGLPTDLFVSVEAHWLGVQVQGQEEQPRVLLLSVPYALKAGDAQTVGGLPPSAFVLAAPGGTSAAAPANPASAGTGDNAPPAGSVTGSGTADYVPLWTSTSNIGNSVLFQAGSGKTAKVGINTITPASTLDVKGGATVRGPFSLPAAGTATASKGFNSQPMDVVSSVFNSGSNVAVPQTFQWQAEPVNNNKTNATGSLNLLWAQGSGKPAETGLNIASTGQVTFATGQTFPGTVGSVTAGTDLTNTGTNGNPILNVDTTKVPQLGGGNSFTGNQTVNGSVSAGQLISTVAQGTAPLQVTSTTQVPNLNASLLDGLPASAFQVVGSYATLGANTFTATQTISSGDVSVSSGNVDLPQTVSNTVGSLTIGGAPFLHACCSANALNTFVGAAAGNFVTTGVDNTAVGYNALTDNIAGYSNTAIGIYALEENGSGGGNTASGYGALWSNTSGTSNTASGWQALGSNIKGSNNTALGTNADVGSGNLQNATAIGANAVVSASNALVLGGTGSNAVSVGIGTATPAATLDVRGTGNFTGNVAFASTQTFPGTITGLTAGAGIQVGSGQAPTVTNTGVLSVTAGSGIGLGGTGQNPTISNTGILGINQGTGISISSGQSPTVSVSGVPLLSGSNVFTSQNTFGIVGIGTTTPAESLDVSFGDMIVRGVKNFQSAGVVANLFVGDSAHEVQAIDAGGIGLGAFQNLNGLFLTDNEMLGTGCSQGFVGIQTTCPRSALELDANVPSGLGPTVTLTNNGGTGQVSLDFNTYTPSTTGTYNPTARIIAKDNGDYSASITFQANKSGAANNGLLNTMSIDSSGNVSITGNISKGGGSFKIDDPLDPANKYLYHSFVESPDMLNIYNGVITLDAHGSAWVTMPDYFEALNRDYRYQLTSIGRPQPNLYIAAEMSGHRFKIAGGKASGKVSWQVTGIRQDAYANAHRIPTEEQKPPQERGKYLHPELFGASEEQAIGYRPALPSTEAARTQAASAAPSGTE